MDLEDVAMRQPRVKSGVKEGLKDRCMTRSSFEGRRAAKRVFKKRSSNYDYNTSNVVRVIKSQVHEECKAEQ